MSPTLQFFVEAFVFIVRVAVPLLVVFGLLYLIKRRMEPRFPEDVERPQSKLPWAIPPALLVIVSLVVLAIIAVLGYALVTNRFVDLLMVFRDVVVVAYMFGVRIGLPIVVVLSLGSLLKRRLSPQVESEVKPLPVRMPVIAALQRVRLPHFSGRAVLAVLFVVGLWTAAIGVTIARFFFGLGYVTNLSDEFPWGIWIAFDVVSGVALAAGGFVIAGTVHVLGLKRFHPILRPAILTALLGYLLVILGLLFDLGRWYNVWHPLFMWNLHSPLLEIAWCVILYTTVLGLEFSPVIFEKLNLRWPLKIVRAITLPLVILGVILSTLHQSSLGSLFLVFPQKINPLWYSPLLPVFFFLTAVAVGLGMVIVESNLSARAFGRALEDKLLADLGRAAAVVLAVYLALKLYDLIARGAMAYLTVSSFHTTLYVIEMAFGVLVPLFLLASRRMRQNSRTLLAAASLMVGGVVLNRLNTALLGWWAYASGGPVYIPSLGELTVTFSLLTAGVAAFAIAARFLPLFPTEKHAAV